MAEFYVRSGAYLVRAGHCADGMEALQAGPGEVVMAGAPPGLDGRPPPFAGARWHIGRACWDDARTEAQRQDAGRQAVIAARAAAYPPLADFADAMYWAAHGDTSKLDAYNAAVTAVKQQFPKI